MLIGAVLHGRLLPPATGRLICYNCLIDKAVWQDRGWKGENFGGGGLSQKLITFIFTLRLFWVPSIFDGEFFEDDRIIKNRDLVAIHKREWWWCWRVCRRMRRVICILTFLFQWPVCPSPARTWTAAWRSRNGAGVVKREKAAQRKRLITHYLFSSSLQTVCSKRPDIWISKLSERGFGIVANGPVSLSKISQS